MAGLVFGTAPVFAQTVEPPPLPRGSDVPEPLEAQIRFKPGVSLSNISLTLSRVETRSHPPNGSNIGETIELQLLQPFSGSPHGAHVAQQGLGSVRSAQLLYTLRRTPLISDRPSDGQKSTVSTIELLAAVGHRSFDEPVAGDSLHRVPFAFGTWVGFSPGRTLGRAGTPRYGVGLQYRRQYLPDAATRAPVRASGAVVSGSVDGALSLGQWLDEGLSYRLSVAQDLNRGITGSDLTLSSSFLEYPKLIVGINLRVQTRDNDIRTRDNRFSISPRLSVQF